MEEDGAHRSGCLLEEGGILTRMKRGRPVREGCADDEGSPEEFGGPGGLGKGGLVPISGRHTSLIYP